MSRRSRQREQTRVLEATMSVTRRQFLEASAGAVVVPSLGAGGPSVASSAQETLRADRHDGVDSRFRVGQPVRDVQGRRQGSRSPGPCHRPGNHLHRHGPRLLRRPERGADRPADDHAPRRGDAGHQADGSQGRRRQAPARAQPEATADRPPRRGSYSRAQRPGRPGRHRSQGRRPRRAPAMPAIRRSSGPSASVATRTPWPSRQRSSGTISTAPRWP